MSHASAARRRRPPRAAVSAARTSVSSAKPSTHELAARARARPVGEVDALQHGGDLVLAVRARGPTTSARLIFAGAGAPDHRQGLGERDELVRRELLGARVGRLADRRERRRGLVARREAGERERVRERLPPVGERGLDEPLELRPKRPAARRARTRRAPSRRSAAGGTPSARPGGSRSSRVASWTRTETAPYAFVRGSAKNRSATSRCTITHQRSSDGMPSRLSTTSGVATLYGQVRDELRRRAARARRGRARARRRSESTLSRPPSASRELRLERAVELDRVDVRDPVGEVAGQDAEARARPRARRRPPASSASRPMTPRMFSSTRKCWPSAFFGVDVHGSPKAAARVRVVCAASSSGSSPRASASAAIVWTTWAGSFRRPRTGCGERYGLSVSARIRSAGTRRARLAQIRPPSGTSRCPRRRRSSRARAPARAGGRREAVEDHVAAEARERGGRVAAASRLWIDDRKPELGRERELRIEERALLGRRRVVVVVVEAGLADRDRLRVREEAREARRAGRASAVAAWCGSMPSAAKTPSCCSASASAARHESIPVPIGDDPRRLPPPRARSTAAAGGPRSASRCACVSVTPRSARCPSARAPRRRRCSGSSFAEQRLRLAERLARRERARLPAPDPGLVVAGQHDVRRRRPPHRPELERAGDQRRRSRAARAALRAERQERREEHLQAVDRAQRDVEDRRRRARGRS